MNITTEAKSYIGQYITIGKGKTVWFVEDVDNAGLRCTASVPGRTAYKRVPLNELYRANLWTREEQEAPVDVEEAKAQHPANGTKQWAVENRNDGFLYPGRYATKDEAQSFTDSVNRYENIEAVVRFLPTREDVAKAVEDVKAEILADIADGTQPADVDDFSTLHDYVDANEYGGFCDDERRAHWETDALIMVQEEVHKWLTTREIIEEECYVCGKHITEADDDRGHVFMDNGSGPAVDVCTDECGHAFYYIPEDEWVKFPKVSE